MFKSNTVMSLRPNVRYLFFTHLDNVKTFAYVVWLICASISACTAVTTFKTTKITPTFTGVERFSWYYLQPI